MARTLGVQSPVEVAGNGQAQFRPLWINGAVATSTTNHTAGAVDYNFSKDPYTDWISRTGGGSTTADRALLMALQPHQLIEFMFWGGNADNEAATMKVHGIDEIMGTAFANRGAPGQPAKSEVVEYTAVNMGTLTITMGTSSIAADGSISEFVYVDPDTDPSNLAFLVDNLSWATEAPTHPVSAQVIGNDANAFARFVMPLAGHVGLICEFDCTSCLWMGGAWRTW